MDPDSEEYAAMLEEIRKELNFSSLHYHRLDDMIEAIGIPSCKLCTYCWNGRE
jgi:amidophosphoribosyltransferase